MALIGLILFKIMKYQNRKIRKASQTILWKFIFSSVPDLLKRVFSCKVGFMVLFFNLFIFFNLSILTNIIKTDKVVIPTDQIIDSPAKLKETDKILVILMSETENIKSSLLIKELIERKNEQDKLLVVKSKLTKEESVAIENNGLVAYFFLMSEVGIYGTVLSLCSTRLIDDLNLFFKPISYYESLGKFILRKNLEKKKKVFLKMSTLRAFEFGLTNRLGNILNSILIPLIRTRIKIFNSLDEFKNEFTTTFDVKVTNFKTIFIILLSSYCLIISIYIVDISNQFLKKKLKKSVFRFRLLIMIIILVLLLFTISLLFIF